MKRLSPEFRDAHPEVPWKQMAGLRDVLSHAYETVRVDDLWRIATSDVPAMAEDIREWLPEHEG